MRLLLDEHLSAQRIGTPLRRRRHDVLALQDDSALWGLSDEEVLELARSESRIVVTCNGVDLMAIARAWADEGRAHAGIVVFWGQRTDAFGAIIASVEDALRLHPDQDTWANLVLSI